MAASPDSAAVTLWRVAYKRNLSVGRKSDVDLTVMDLNLWVRVIEFAQRRKWNPNKIEWLLSQYEDWERDG